ncbi:MAG: PTS sugar transporter subunit IIA [Treponema sp.]|nr:PTS sugar transporter subunit IIA [Treponema sp.]
MVLGEIFPKDTIVVELSSTEKDELFEELVETIHSNHPIFDKQEALKVLNERESKMSTGIMHAVGLPHALITSMNGHDTIGAVGISREGLDYEALDNAPVNVVFMIIGAENDTNSHIQVLKQLAMVLQLPNFVNNLLANKTASEIHNFICKSEESLIN